MLRENTPHEPLHVYAAVNPDETIRMQSSSGGIFTLLAESIIDKGGVVFGARFNDNWEVVHDYTESKEGLKAFRGSKYVQSRTSGIFKQVRDFLKNGRLVLFSGTPCQIAGLKLFLRKDFENLLTIEVVCHGVPSPLVWRRYLSEELSRTRGVQILSVNFRDKRYGWSNYHFSMKVSLSRGKEKEIVYPHDDSPFMRGFLRGLYIRSSCSNCKAKCGSSMSDITLGDLWGISTIAPDMDDNKGGSEAICHTLKGLNLFHSLSAYNKQIKYSDAAHYNPSLISSSSPSPLRNAFWEQSLQGISATIDNLCGDTWLLKLKKKIYNILFKKKYV